MTRQEAIVGNVFRFSSMITPAIEAEVGRHMRDRCEREGKVAKLPPSGLEAAARIEARQVQILAAMGNEWLSVDEIARRSLFSANEVRQMLMMMFATERVARRKSPHGYHYGRAGAVK